MLRLAEEASLNHGYLENQVFFTAVQRGKEVIWRRGVPAAGRPYSPAPPRSTADPTPPGSGSGEAGWGRSLGHDVSQRRGGPLPAHRARQGT